MEKNRYIKEEYRQFSRPKFYDTTLILEGHEGKFGFPKVEIWVNDMLYYNDFVIGEKEITFQVKDIRKRNLLKIEMSNKIPNDTIIENKKIIKDKKLQIKKIFLDHIDIKDNKYLGRQKPLYHYKNQGPRTILTEWLFFQGKWRYYFENPPIYYFTKLQKYQSLLLSKKNVDYVEIMKKLKEHSK